MKSFKMIMATLALSTVTLLAGDPENVVLVRCELTAYCGCKHCCGDFPGKIRNQTASGTMAKEGQTLAAPKVIPFGTKVWWIPEGGSKQGLVLLGTVEDRGGAIRKRADGTFRIDVYFSEHQKALEFGRKKGMIAIDAKILDKKEG